MAVTIRGSGQVPVQVVTQNLTSTFSAASSAFTNVTGLSATITPTSSSNKVLVLVSLSCAASATVTGFARVTRNGTAAFVGDVAGSRIQTDLYFRYYSANEANSYPMMFLDSPATTSAVTYQVQIGAEGGSPTIYVNRSTGDVDNTNYGRSASSITVMEIAYA
jgi:hypothetical protein